MGFLAVFAARNDTPYLRRGFLACRHNDNDGRSADRLKPVQQRASAMCPLWDRLQPVRQLCIIPPRPMIATLNDIYDVTCALDRAAVFQYKREGKWVDTAVGEFRDTVRYVATALRHAGVKPGDRVAILSENRPEW